MPVPLPLEDRARHIATLSESRDAGQLAAAATVLARSGDRDATLALGRALRSPEFLERLDPPVDGSTPISNILAVFSEFSEHPTEWSGRLCELIYAEPAFRAVLARVNSLLGALAAVVPMTEHGAAIFRAGAAEGFAEVIGPLLLQNGSPLALKEFEELIGNGAVEEHVRVSILHYALLPFRTRLAVVESCARMLAVEPPGAVRTALVETLFDHQSRLWFGPAMSPPEPEPWSGAETAALERLAQIADEVLTVETAPLLANAVRATRAEIVEILRSRRQ
ncbi:MAG: hypothetical protein ACKV2U_04190 [Bryobacteraceae bacterium]